MGGFWVGRDTVEHHLAYHHDCYHDHEHHHVYPGPETGWDTWEFFPGPTALGGPMGGKFFSSSFKQEKN